MVSPFVKLYVYRKLQSKRSFSEIEDILLAEIEKYLTCEKVIKYNWFWSAGANEPNASATIPGLILINAEWAYRIVIDNDNCNMHNAFDMTVCHELTHQENDFFYVGMKKNDVKFVNWINEVHADFGAIQKAFNGKRSYVKDAIEYKLKCKMKKDRDTWSHPSWHRRMNYLQKYNFDEKLISNIAGDVGCENDLLIEAIGQHFDKIVLEEK